MKKAMRMISQIEKCDLAGVSYSVAKVMCCQNVLPYEIIVLPGHGAV
jgi:hypothetical protein